MKVTTSHIMMEVCGGTGHVMMEVYGATSDRVGGEAIYTEVW